MAILLKRFNQTSEGIAEDGSRQINRKVLTVGASSDRDIIVDWPGVQLRHAKIELTDDKQLQLQTHAQDKLALKRQGLFKRRKSRNVLLRHNEGFTLGNQQFLFEVVDEKPVLSITTDERLSKPKTRQFQTRVIHASASKRTWSVTLLSIIALLFVAFPLAKKSLENDRKDDTLSDWLPAQVSAYVPVQLAGIKPSKYSELLPSDVSWNTGNFHPAHQFFANECDVCHQTGFEQVSKNTCMTCHESIFHHFPPDAPELSQAEETNCQTCHKEHNGEEKLVTDNQSLCIDCHQNIAGFTQGMSKLAAVSDWQHTHPEITFTMTHWDEISGGWTQQEVNANNPTPEANGLVFPHDLHLRAEGFERDNGTTQVLACADCHIPERGGKLMQPVSMEQHCESCHSLEIEVDNRPQRIEHGNVNDVLVQIAGLKRLNTVVPASLDQSEPISSVPAVTLQLPGKQNKLSLNAQQAQTLATVAGDLIEKRACITCHGVDVNSAAKAQNQLNQAWTIEPVQVVSRWINDAEFDHGKHSSMDCGGCHAGIQQSAVTADVNIPNRALCQSCHGDPDENDLTPSECIDCHDYHIVNHGLIDFKPTSATKPMENNQ